MKRKFINLFASLFLITSCSHNDEYIRVGFDEVIGQSNPTSMVGTGLKAKKVQTFESSFDVYVGAMKEFTDYWKKDEQHVNPGCGAFAIKTRIFKNRDEVISCSFSMLYDFPNFEKYPMEVESIEGSVDGYRSSFKTFFTFNYDFNLIDFNEGSIAFHISYYDDIDRKEYTNVFNHVGTDGQTLKFKKNNENKTVTFSKF